MKAGSSIFLALAASTAAQKCSPLELVYARPTGEPPAGITLETTSEGFEAAAAKVWSKGYGAAGASLLGNLTTLIPDVTGYPVHYLANWQMNISAPTGVKDMLARLDKQAKACPKQLFALGGHSQGSGVTVSTIPKIPQDILKRVVAVTMFGGRPCPAEVKDKCKSFCNAGDGCMNPDAKGKGSMAKGPMALPKGPKGPKAPASGPATALVASPAHLKRGYPQMVERQASALDCSKEVEEKGHVPITVKGESAHTVYNKDGYYIKAAACYIVSKYKEASK